MQQNWEGRTRGGLSGYKIFIFILKKAGIKSAYLLLRFIALWFAIFSFKGAKAQYVLFRKRLNYSALKSIFSVYKNHYIFGQVLLDKIAILSGMRDKFTYEHTNEDVIKNMLINKTGGILINAHIGSWEMAGQLLEMHGDKIYVVMLDAEHEKIKNYVSEVTGGNKIEIIPIKNDGSHIIKIDEVLKDKGIIAMHGDRFMDSANFEEFDFLGKKAKFPTGPFHLAAKYSVPFTFATAFKEKKLHYHFFAAKAQYVKYPGNIAERKIEIKKSMQNYVSQLEETIKKYPIQWFNYYNFWN
jgi:predicted LPLAT superfamily acyltransferase